MSSQRRSHRGVRSLAVACAATLLAGVLTACGAGESEGELTAAEVKTQITDPDVTWSLTPTGFGEFADFMESVEMIKKAPAAEDIYVDNEFNADAA
ncbi:hypothetical protein [Nocardioides sp. NPDC047086]|uniref:hypothetical protein n=1 Tax=Nocardioides sp. NPDC047086 TaxID=3154810 RepID=UPI0033D6A1EB